MNICSYCYKKGMTLEQYENFKNNIKETAKAIRMQLKYNGGIYYPTNELFTYGTNEDIKAFIIQELKQIGIEFFDNNSMYMVTD